MNFLNQNSAPAISGNLANYAFRGNDRERLKIADKTRDINLRSL